jgi:hypothetical protein
LTDSNFDVNIETLCQIKASDLLSFVTDVSSAFTRIFSKTSPESCCVAFGQERI